ncbi:MAG TPA: cytochrome c3 family protein [Deltaproteobacteria bacterium]|nr:cytochrome c3 family protein [Deltaproteobacteria bacterium]HOI08456.1 cytochrome c3 family protein [Deltaproteobacteria bacterium]
MGLLLFLFAAPHAAWTQSTPDAGALLGDRHKAAGIECARCHKDKPSAPVPASICTGCHADMAKSEKIRDNLPNPHNSHMPYPECSSCHHAHKPSENQCASCHNFSFRMR